MSNKTKIYQIVCKVTTKVSNLYGDSDIFEKNTAYITEYTRLNEGMPIVFEIKDLDWHFQMQNNIPFIVDPDGQSVGYFHLVGRKELLLYFTGTKLMILDGPETFFKRMKMKTSKIF